jgi:hypothetical protein
MCTRCGNPFIRCGWFVCDCPGPRTYARCDFCKVVISREGVCLNPRCDYYAGGSEFLKVLRESVKTLEQIEMDNEKRQNLLLSVYRSKENFLKHFGYA